MKSLLLFLALFINCHTMLAKNLSIKNKSSLMEIQIQINPNKSQEFLYPLILKSKYKNDITLKLDSKGFFDENNQLSSELTTAVSFYIVDLKKKNKKLFELHKEKKLKRGYFCNKKLGLKVEYDISKINGNWHRIENGIYKNKISIYLKEDK